MNLFALADPHLGLTVDKPMHIFGAHWQNHETLLRENWLDTVGSDDTVLIAGDISWAMHLHEVIADLRFLDQLPGEKILLRGNHDYWWASMNKLQELCEREDFRSLRFLRNNSLLLRNGDVVCGTRGWLLPDDPEFSADDLKIYQREIGRLDLSLQAASKIRREGSRLIACLHYPPFNREYQPNEITDRLSAAGADLCVYGHIHGERARSRPPVVIGPTKYYLTSADAIAFKPLRL